MRASNPRMGQLVQDPIYTVPWAPCCRSRDYKVAHEPTVLETLGADPISKLAAAIDRLAAALEKKI